MDTLVRALFLALLEADLRCAERDETIMGPDGWEAIRAVVERHGTPRAARSAVNAGEHEDIWTPALHARRIEGRVVGA